jgi:hypothetical protein
MFQFQAGKPACPIACKYCHVTELDADRTAKWSSGLIGINKACTFINVPPWINEDPTAQANFDNIPYELLSGDWVGWTAVTDGLMPSLRKYFWQWVERSSRVAKLITVVSKWPINRQLMKELATIDNLYLVITITGNPSPIELVDTRVHLRTLALAAEYGVKTLPMCHPYIAGVSDLSFLTELANLGYQSISVKGLRYNPTTMSNWMPLNSQAVYDNTSQEEVLPDDGWREQVIDSGLSLLSPQQWYRDSAINLYPKLDLESATTQVNTLFNYCQIASSSSSQSVIDAVVKRKM